MLPQVHKLDLFVGTESHLDETILSSEYSLLITRYTEMTEIDMVVAYLF